MKVPDRICVGFSFASCVSSDYFPGSPKQAEFCACQKLEDRLSILELQADSMIVFISQSSNVQRMFIEYSLQRTNEEVAVVNRFSAQTPIRTEW